METLREFFLKAFTVTEMVQWEAALVPGPQLEVLGTKVHGRQPDSGTWSLQA